MEKFIVTLKDRSKRKFFLDLLAKFDFLEFKSLFISRPPDQEGYDFFKSAGLLSKRPIDAQQLRKEAWSSRE